MFRTKHTKLPHNTRQPRVTENYRNPDAPRGWRPREDAEAFPVTAASFRRDGFVTPALGGEASVESPWKRTRNRLLAVTAGVGVLALGAASFVVSANREPAPQLPTAGSEAAQKGLMDGTYQELAIGQTVFHKDGRKEVLDNINEVAGIVREYGGADSGYDLAKQLSDEHDRFVQANGTQLSDPRAVADQEVFIVPHMPDFGSSSLPDDHNG